VDEVEGGGKGKRHDERKKGRERTMMELSVMKTTTLVDEDVEI